MATTMQSNVCAFLQHGDMRRVVLGGTVWLWVTIGLPPVSDVVNWPVSLLLLAALVVVPLLTPLTVQVSWHQPTPLIWRTAIALQPSAALSLVIAHLLPAGLAAGLLTLPWSFTTGLLGLAGAERLWRRGSAPLFAVGGDVSLLYLAVGGGWTLLSRLGLRPLSFDPTIVLLTAIHFHYAGCVLPLLTSLAAQAYQGWVGRLAVIGAVLGVPSVAMGITAAQLGFGPLLESLAACLTAIVGLLTAGLHIQLLGQRRWPWPARLLWGVAALSLGVSMALAAAYGIRAYLPLSDLHIPAMWATHGSANALGFGLGGVIAWRLAQRQDT